MDPSIRQHQEMSNPSMENMSVNSKGGVQQERKPRPPHEQALKCPRCDSTNTKFCYYNNYSLSQPRYFCKSCRRYWTKGGTLRNVPVGGGCRKNKRSSSSSKRSSQDQPLTPNTNYPFTTNSTTHLPPLNYDTNDLSLAFARLQKQQPSFPLGFDHELGSPSLNSSTNPAIVDALRNSFLGNQNNFQNFYYGFGNENMTGEIENMGFNGELMIPYHNNNEEMSNGSTVTTMKQELSMNDFDSGRGSWISGFNSSNWHGLINIPLM